MMCLRDGPLPGFKKERERVYSECKGITFFLTAKENANKFQKTVNFLWDSGQFSYFCSVKRGNLSL